MNDNQFKKKSLCDNFYFTLRDIFTNTDSFDICDIANYFNTRLANNICFEDRTERFEYTNLLHEKNYVKYL